MSTHAQYPTDLTDRQWHLLHPLLPTPRWQPGGRGRRPRPLRRVLNGILYVTKTGCQWRQLPPSFGRWSTIYGYFNRWARQGVWQQIHTVLIHRERQRQGRPRTSSAGCIDSQSIKMAHQRGPKEFDAGKQVHGRKRHCLVDTLGLIIGFLVTPANTPDPAGLKALLTTYFSTGVQRLRKVWVDGGYRGDDLKAWVAQLKQTHKIDLEVVKKKGTGFTVLPHRWVVERTFAWLLNYRRHSKDYEVLTRNSEAFIQVAMIQLLVKRLV